MVQYKTFGLKHYIVFVKKKACSRPNYFLTHHFLHHYFQNRDFSTVSTSSVSASIQQRDGYSNVLGEDGRGRAPTHRWNYFQLVLFVSSCPPTSWPPPSMKKSLCLKSCVRGLMEHKLFDLNKTLTTASSAPATGSSQGGWNWKLRLIQVQYWRCSTWGVAVVQFQHWVLSMRSTREGFVEAMLVTNMITTKIFAIPIP